MAITDAAGLPSAACLASASIHEVKLAETAFSLLKNLKNSLATKCMTVTKSIMISWKNKALRWSRRIAATARSQKLRMDGSWGGINAAGKSSGFSLGGKTSGDWLSDMSVMLIISCLFSCLPAQLFCFVLFEIGSCDCSTAVAFKSMSISDSFYSQHDSKIHQSPPLFQFPIRHAAVRSGTPRSVGSLRQTFFSQLRTHRFFGTIRSSAYISDSAAVESLHFDLILNARLPCVTSIVMLKTFSAFIAATPLGSIFTESVFHQVFSSAASTLYLDILFHNDWTIYRRGSCKSTDSTYYWSVFQKTW